MLLKTKKRSYAIIFSLLLAAGAVTWFASASSTARLYMSPASQSVAQNGSFDVAVRLHSPSSSVDYVRAYISFPADKLQVTSISAAGSAFNYQHEQSFDNSSGHVRLGRYSYGSAVSGDLLVVTITFQAKSSGDAVAAFQDGSSVRLLSDAHQERLTDTASGEYKITSTVVTPPAASPASSPDPALSPNPNPVSSQTQRPPGSPFTAYRPPTTESASGQPRSNTFDADSVPVKIVILSQKRQPLRDVQVTVDGLTQTTDHDGTVLFALQPGSTVAQVKSGRVTKDFDIAVEDTGDQQVTLPIEQSFVFVLPQTGTISAFFGGVLIIPMGGLTAYIISRRRKLRRIDVPVFGYAPASHLRKPQPKKQDSDLTLDVHPHKLATASIVKIRHATAMPKPSQPPPVKKRHSASVLLPTKAKTLTLHPITPHLSSTIPAASVEKTLTTVTASIHPSLSELAAEPVKQVPKENTPDPRPYTQNVIPESKGSKTPEWQLEIQRQLAKDRPAVEYEEPTDMFEVADQQFHYDQKFGNVPPSKRSSPKSAPKQDSKRPQHKPEDLKKPVKKYLF